MLTWNTLDGRAPRIIAHRGASGLRPEHTLDSYALAIAQGAEVIEPDLVLSRDGILFARHDVGLSRSTDVASRKEFAASARLIDGVHDWWSHDFTATEIERLRTIQPWPGRSHEFDGREPPPRFASVLALVQAAGRRVIVYPELKDPHRFLDLGLDPVACIVATLQAQGMTGADAPVWLQCFDHAVLRQARDHCGNRCFALMETVTDVGRGRSGQLQALASWADGVAPSKRLLWDMSGADSGFVIDAHAVGLEVHAWTFREDTSPAPFVSSRTELEAAFALGVDALFCDFPAVALAARSSYAQGRAD